MPKEKRCFSYPLSKSWIYFSVTLLFLSLIFMLMLSSNDINVIGLYFLATFITAVPAYIIKIRIYSRKAEGSNDPSSRKGVTIKSLVMLFLSSLILLFLPFVFLRLFGLHAWLILVNSYISGVNASEIMIYLIHCR